MEGVQGGASLEKLQDSVLQLSVEFSPWGPESMIEMPLRCKTTSSFFQPTPFAEVWLRRAAHSIQMHCKQKSRSKFSRSFRGNLLESRRKIRRSWSPACLSRTRRASDVTTHGIRCTMSPSSYEGCLIISNNRSHGPRGRSTHVTS